VTSGGNAMPSPATSTTTPPARNGSHRRRSASDASSATTPSTAIWLPTSTVDLSSGAASSAPSDRRIDSGHTGIVWRPGGVTLITATSPSTSAASTASAVTSRPSRSIAGRPMVAASPLSTRDQTPAAGRQREQDGEDRQLEQQQVTVRRAEQAGHAPDLRPRVPHTGGDEHHHERQRGRGEAPGGEHGVGTRVGAALLTGEREQEGQGGEATDPDAGGQQVRHVDCDRRRRVRLDGGGVAGRRDQTQRTQAEQRALAPRRTPVRAVREVHPHGEKRAPHQEERVRARATRRRPECAATVRTIAPPSRQASARPSRRAVWPATSR
jgi:hypothetical protein